MAEIRQLEVWELLLTRRGTVYVDDAGEDTDAVASGLALELAQLGYVPTAQLRTRLARAAVNQLGALRDQWLDALSRRRGSHVQHTPLFRRFPDGVPDDTAALWWKRVLVHYLQAPGQTCIHCHERGTTHVLVPCEHVVCDHCFDGENYSGCPICGRKVDTDSPFFLPTPERPVPKERVRFEVLHLGTDLDGDARRLFESLCARPQALSPDDRDALVSLLLHYGQTVLDWIPAKIPLRENIAVIFATLFGTDDSPEILAAAAPHMTTATDVLRFIAVLSGTDGSLLPEMAYRTVELTATTHPWWVRMFEKMGVATRNDGPHRQVVHVPIARKRFAVAKLRRATRRALLAMLESFDPERLTEDMLRHRSYWVWVGEFLHPHEYAKRFPNVAAAFRVVRRKAPSGEREPPFRTWNSKLEASISTGNYDDLLARLGERPGDFGRRLDHVLRLAPDAATAGRVQEAFVELIPRLATPMLLTLLTHFERRGAPQPIRVYWPKGTCAFGASTRDRRKPLPGDVTGPLCAAIQAELIERMASKPALDLVVLDRKLEHVTVPFNERTAARAAISLTRGSTVDVPDGKFSRLFLHWCQPEGDFGETDLDLSVGFYRDDWSYVGPCSYYELKLAAKDGSVIAKSAGDFTSAPFPEGASEFIDIDHAVALEAGVRYAVMVVNAYSGLPFGALKDAFAGLMLREDPMGQHFDPRTVELKFDLQGENGIYLPLCFDLVERRLHWLDVSAKGQFIFNNVETSNKDIRRVVPDLLQYFGSGVRPSMFRLGLLHAVARARSVVVRDGGWQRYDRRASEQPDEFLRRIESGEPDAREVSLADKSLLALLYRGDLELPDNPETYALFRGQVKTTLSASDLLS